MVEDVKALALVTVAAEAVEGAVVMVMVKVATEALMALAELQAASEGIG